jgi:ABC-type multidrug transport system ATPase subunit
MENNIPISNLSTGQLKTVDMCIILGILDVIMHNVNFNICFLDELFSNMDGELRQLMCQVLKSNLKENQILFIISHIELDDKYFNGEISAHLEYVNNSILKKSVYKITKF